jgi:energy-coupling factor transport system substrate-specific component
VSFASPAEPFAVRPPETRWRTIDIVVVAVVAVAFGVVFWAWGLVWIALDPVFAAVKPLQYLISGVWLLPAVVCPLIVRKPGAAVFGEVVAALVPVALGTPWGLDVVLSGFVQGAGAELVFAFTLYRAWGLPVALFAGAGAAVGEAIHDLVLYREYFESLATVAGAGIGLFLAGIVISMLVSGVLIAGLGGWLLVRALRQTGVLEAFPSSET